MEQKLCQVPPQISPVGQSLSTEGPGTRSGQITTIRAEDVDISRLNQVINPEQNDHFLYKLFWKPFLVNLMRCRFVDTEY